MNARVLELAGGYSLASFVQAHIVQANSSFWGKRSKNMSGWRLSVCRASLLVAVVVAFAWACLPVVSLAQQQQDPPGELPPPQAGVDQSAQGEGRNGNQQSSVKADDSQTDAAQIPEFSSSLQAGQEAYHRAEQQRLDAMSRQLGLSEAMRWRAALPPVEAYYSPGFFGGYAGPSYSLADSIMESPWRPWSNVDFGYRYDNPVRQPIGVESVQTGPNTWESRPLYAGDQLHDSAQTDGVAVQTEGVHPLIETKAARSASPTENLDMTTVRRRAFAALEQAEFQMALEGASQMLQLDPTNSEAMHLSLHADVGLMRFADAVVDLDLALSNSPQDWNLIVKDYRLYYGKAGAFTRQLRKAESAVRENSSDTNARLILGYLYAGLGYEDEAASQLREVVRQANAEETVARLAKTLLDEIRADEVLPQPPRAGNDQDATVKARSGRIL